jgi:energy-coupling factor transport system ATP-binding protein
MSELIRAEGLVHRYAGTGPPALDYVDLVIRAGERVAIIGPNGSGKSTLAKHLNALLLPSDGRVLIDGLDTRDVANLWEIRRRVGMVFQNPDNQIVATVVEEDVAFGPENLGVPPAEIRRRIDDALERVAMTAHARREPHLLSGGQKQRVAVAGVLAMRPLCIVLDEATSMLDPSGRSELMGVISELNKSLGLTVVQITHHMDEALLADRVVVMDQGRITLDGTPARVFEADEKLRHSGLDRPTIVRLVDAIRRRGVAVPPGVLSAEALVRSLEEVRPRGSADRP